MSVDDIKNYIKSYKDLHSKEEIIESLRNSNVSEEDIQQAYNQLDSGGYNNKNKPSALKILAIVFGVLCFIVVSIFIVNVILFSQVDFGSLMPEESSSLVADDTSQIRNIRIDTDSVSIIDSSSQIRIPFTYLGSSGMEVVYNMSMSSLSQNPSLLLESGESCEFSHIENVDTQIKSSQQNNDVKFLHSHDGEVIFDCSSDVSNQKSIVGKFEMTTKDLRDNLINSGNITLSISKKE